jgi:hypothetical protein
MFTAKGDFHAKILLFDTPYSPLSAANILFFLNHDRL